MKCTPTNMNSVSPFSASPARAFIELGCAYQLTGTQADPTA
jgi:hypothetical protein